jgi:hypothetical protein
LTGDHHGNVIHNANQILGRCALREGKLIDAPEYLLKADTTPGSPQLNSSGPQMHLSTPGEVFRFNSRFGISHGSHLTKANAQTANSVKRENITRHA